MNREQWCQKRGQFDEDSMALADASQMISSWGEANETTIARVVIGFCDCQVTHHELTCCEWAAALQADSAEGEKPGNAGSCRPTLKTIGA